MYAITKGKKKGLQVGLLVKNKTVYRIYRIHGNQEMKHFENAVFAETTNEVFEILMKVQKNARR